MTTSNTNTERLTIEVIQWLKNTIPSTNLDELLPSHLLNELENGVIFCQLAKCISPQTKILWFQEPSTKEERVTNIQAFLNFCKEFLQLNPSDLFYYSDLTLFGNSQTSERQERVVSGLAKVAIACQLRGITSVAEFEAKEMVLEHQSSYDEDNDMQSKLQKAAALGLQLTQEIEELNEKLETLQSQYLDKRQEVSDLEFSLKHLTETIQFKDEEIDELKQKNKELNDRIESLQNQNQRHVRARSYSDAAAHSLEDEFNKKCVDYEALLEEMHELKEEIVFQKTAFETQKNESEKTIFGLQEEISKNVISEIEFDEQNRKIRLLKVEIEKLTEDLQEAREQLEQKDDIISQLQLQSRVHFEQNDEKQFSIPIQTTAPSRIRQDNLEDFYTHGGFSPTPIPLSPGRKFAKFLDSLFMSCFDVKDKDHID